MSKFICVMVLLLAVVVSGCTVGTVSRSIDLTRDMDAASLDYVHRVQDGYAADRFSRNPGVEVRLGDQVVRSARGGERESIWFFPLYSGREAMAIAGAGAEPLVAVARSNEIPAIAPGLGAVLGGRRKAGAHFDAATGARVAKVTRLELNPLIQLGYSYEKRHLRGWMCQLVWGLVGVGSAPEGAHFQLLWLIRLGPGRESAFLNTMSVTIKPSSRRD